MSKSASDEVSDFDKAAKVKHAFSDLNRKFEEREASGHAAKWSLQYFDLTGFPIDQNTLALIPETEARAAFVVPFFREGPHVKLGVADPKDKNLSRIVASLKLKKVEPEIYLVSKSALLESWGQYRKILPDRPAQSYDVPVTTGGTVLERLHGLAELSRQRLLEMPLTDLLAILIGGAATMRASDLHLEPEKDIVKLRFRVDGVLADVLSFPKELLHPLLSRIKLLSRLKLNVTQEPQDGRFTVRADGKNLDLRVPVLPTAFGQSLVLRLLWIHHVGF